MTSAARRIAVIGGGVVGLSLAWRLAERGARPTVFEWREAGAGASSAAAGMLAASAEAGEADDAFFALCRQALDRWPGFAARLAEASGREIALRLDGLLIAAREAAEARALAGRADRLRRLGVRADYLEGAQARRLEPLLARDVVGALLLPDEGQVEARALAPALAEAATRAGASIVSGRRIVAVETRGGRVRSLRDESGMRIETDAVAIATGAWSAGLAIEAEEGTRSPVPVAPVKGQMLSLRTSGALPWRVLWGPGIYLVPRADGRLLLGATMEEAGFDPRVTAGGVAGLLAAALALVPAAGDWTMGEMWTGFRPRAPDGLPLLGRGPAAGLVLATGHHRNGILLAPLTAELLADLVLEDRERAELKPFSPARFETGLAGPRVHADRNLD